MTSTYPLSSEGPQLHRDSTVPRKKRKTLACNNCRRQKLRCDRANPVCGRCYTTGYADFCMYGRLESDPKQHPINENQELANHETNEHFQRSAGSYTTLQSAGAVAYTTSNHPSSTDPFAFLPLDVEGTEEDSQHVRSRRSSPETLQNRQPSIMWRGHGQTSSGTATVEQSTTVKRARETEQMTFRGKLFQTQYFGATNPISWGAQFSELQNFMVESISRDSTLAQVQRSLKTLQLQWKKVKPTVAELGNIDSQHLLNLLPDQPTAERLINVYWSTFETTHRILYRPKFWIDYHILWSNPMTASAEFVVIVLLAMASVSCIIPQERMSYKGDSSSPRERAIAWVEICEHWLDRQSQKNISLSHWQGRCLLLLAKISNTIKKKQTWNVAGTLIRQAMSAGFHKDPSLLGTPMNLFNQEMRRRLWATMVELELQVSVDRGMPSAAVNISWSATNVLNVEDEELGEGDDASLRLHTWNSPTSASFLHIGRKSLPLRLSLNTFLNNSSEQITHDSAFDYDEQLKHHLQEIGTYYPSFEVEGLVDAVPSLSEALLVIQLQQYLLLLHTPFAIKLDSSARHSASRLACLDAASAIMEKCSKLSVIDYNVISLSRTEVFRSAFVTCQVIEAMRGLQHEKLLQRLGNSLHGYLDMVLARLGDNITQLGTGFTHYWYISAANRLLKSRLSLADVQVEHKVAVDQVIKQYYKVLASQEDVSTTSALTKYRQTYGLNRETLNTMVYDTNVASAEPQGAQVSFELQPLDPQVDEFFFGDPVAWTFENI